MKNIKKINLAEVSDKQALSMDQFSKIIGGSVVIQIFGQFSLFCTYRFKKVLITTIE